MHKIPNIIFHGQSGCGKRTIVNQFINIIYNNDKERIKSFVMYVNCAHGKGIKFIREELKFFAKTHIHSNGGDIFKSIILSNADKLTIDAQSALRRCIELFSHTTRFFIIVEDKYKLLKPILSRFCEIYVPEPSYNGENINLYKYNLEKTFKLKDSKTLRAEWLKKELQNLDLIHMLEKPAYFKIPTMTENKRYELLFGFNRVRKEFRNEKLFILFILNFMFLSLDDSLENISFM
jgi:GTPase SAR1 family protein